MSARDLPAQVAQSNADNQLLLAGFDYHGTPLDLYGDRDGEVLTITAPGSRQDISQVLRDEVLVVAQHAVDSARRERRQNAADQMQFDRLLERMYPLRV